MSLALRAARELRKVLHAFLALGFIFLAQYVSATWVAVSAAILLGVFMVAHAVRYLEPIRRAEMKSYGEYFFACGVLVTTLMFLPNAPHAFVGGLLVLGFADSAASLVGRRFGRHTYHVGGERRSCEGTATAWFVSSIILAGVGVPLPLAFGGGVFLAMVEAVSVRGSDNVTLPVLAAALIAYLT